jgi:uncharacterized damage-inducible protein DinB
MPDTCREDLIELSDYAWRRLGERMAGLTDAEYRWEPVPGFTTLAWRLCHIADLLREHRNGPWLGRPAPPARGSEGDPPTARAALSALTEAHDSWRTILTATTEQSLAEPMGPVAGHYADATRRSFVLHILDELIHHGAEAALLRDLYAAGAGAAGPRA